ncbi:MAG: hypothetical protein HYV55_02175 [Parcubacteria group bacterium]|nr:hypothetical protein [Parcubacteria group bacterium]
MPEGPEEQLEFLRREDIRTMAKDMARLREEEAKKERESLRASPSGIDLPKPLSRAKKIFVRVAIIFLILFIIVNVIALIYSFTPIRLWIQNY